MVYINALELIELCVKNDILKTINGHIYVYRDGINESQAGWELTDKDILAKELMDDDDGQKILIMELAKKNIKFVPIDHLSYF